MGGGGKGGSSSTQAEIPKYIQDAQKANIDYAADLAKTGYQPWMGADVAALTPMQQNAMQGAGQASSAFGLAPDNFDAMAGMPQAQEFAGGVMGHSSFPMYEQAKREAERYAPAQQEAYQGLFMDPGTPDDYQYMQQELPGGPLPTPGEQMGYDMGGPDAAGLQQQGMSDEQRQKLMALSQYMTGGQQGGQLGLLQMITDMQNAKSGVR